MIKKTIICATLFLFNIGCTGTNTLLPEYSSNASEKRVATRGQSWREPITGILFYYIEPGSFWMGSPKEELGRENDEQRHRVKLTKGFWIGETAVRQGEFAKFIESTGYKTEAEEKGGSAAWDGTTWDHGSNGINWRDSGGPNYPVVHVSWNDAQAFVKWLNNQIEDGIVMLPTEAQWEYSARAGHETATYAGDLTFTTDCVVPQLEAIAWYCGNSQQKVHPVKQKAPNDWRLYDMIGNVYEWVADWYNPNYLVDENIDPAGPGTGSERVARSGSFAHGAMGNRAAGRAKDEPGQHDNVVGFRVILIDN